MLQCSIFQIIPIVSRHLRTIYELLVNKIITNYYMGTE